MARSRRTAAKPIHTEEATTASIASRMRSAAKRQLFTGTVKEEKRVLDKHTKSLHDAAARMRIVGKK